MAQTINETSSERPIDLDSVEEALQKQYQMAVIKSHNMENFPPPKDYQPAQKDTASKLYDLVNNCHYLSLKTINAKKNHEESVKALELKWISAVEPIGAGSKEDNSSEELKNWFNQMKSYEKCYNKAVEKSPDNIKLTFMDDFQLCFDTTYTQEAFQECLEFCTQNRDHTLKLTITYDGEISVRSSLYMETLKEVVETCFSAKMLVNDFIRQIWDLFKETFCE